MGQCYGSELERMRIFLLDPYPDTDMHSEPATDFSTQISGHIADKKSSKNLFFKGVRFLLSHIGQQRKLIFALNLRFKKVYYCTSESEFVDPNPNKNSTGI
jgi:hypothetical protein